MKKLNSVDFDSYIAFMELRESLDKLFIAVCNELKIPIIVERLNNFLIKIGYKG